MNRFDEHKMRGQLFQALALLSNILVHIFLYFVEFLNEMNIVFDIMRNSKNLPLPFMPFSGESSS